MSFCRYTLFAFSPQAFITSCVLFCISVCVCVFVSGPLRQHGIDVAVVGGGGGG